MNTAVAAGCDTGSGPSWTSGDAALDSSFAALGVSPLLLNELAHIPIRERNGIYCGTVKANPKNVDAWVRTAISLFLSIFE